MTSPKEIAKAIAQKGRSLEAALDFLFTRKVARPLDRKFEALVHDFLGHPVASGHHPDTPTDIDELNEIRAKLKGVTTERFAHTPLKISAAAGNEVCKSCLAEQDNYAKNIVSDLKNAEGKTLASALDETQAPELTKDQLNQEIKDILNSTNEKIEELRDTINLEAQAHIATYAVKGTLEAAKELTSEQQTEHDKTLKDLLEKQTKKLNDLTDKDGFPEEFKQSFKEVVAECQTSQLNNFRKDYAKEITEKASSTYNGQDLLERQRQLVASQNEETLELMTAASMAAAQANKSQYKGINFKDYNGKLKNPDTGTNIIKNGNSFTIDYTGRTIVNGFKLVDRPSRSRMQADVNMLINSLEAEFGKDISKWPELDVTSNNPELLAMFHRELEARQVCYMAEEKYSNIAPGDTTYLDKKPTKADVKQYRSEVKEMLKNKVSYNSTSRESPGPWSPPADTEAQALDEVETSLYQRMNKIFLENSSDAVREVKQSRQVEQKQDYKTRFENKYEELAKNKSSTSQPGPGVDVGEDADTNSAPTSTR